MSFPEPVQPPRAAVWLVGLFTPPERTEAILGDLQEEFTSSVAAAGLSSARRRFWKEAVRTVAHLAWAGLRAAPWTTATVVIGAFLLRWYVSRLASQPFLREVDLILQRFGIYDKHPHAYIYWYTHSLYAERFVVNGLLGVAVGLLSKGREMAAALTLAVVGDLLAVQAMANAVAVTGDHGFLWTLPWSFGFSIAIVIGAAMVRIRRSRRTVTVA